VERSLLRSRNRWIWPVYKRKIAIPYGRKLRGVLFVICWFLAAWSDGNWGGMKVLHIKIDDLLMDWWYLLGHVSTFGTHTHTHTHRRPETRRKEGDGGKKGRRKEQRLLCIGGRRSENHRQAERGQAAPATPTPACLCEEGQSWSNQSAWKRSRTDGRTVGDCNLAWCGGRSILGTTSVAGRPSPTATCGERRRAAADAVEAV